MVGTRGHQDLCNVPAPELVASQHASHVTKAVWFWSAFLLGKKTDFLQPADNSVKVVSDIQVGICE